MRIIIYLCILCAVPAVVFGQQPQQVLVTDDTCQLRLNFGYSYNANHKYKEAYDSLRKFVETCPLHVSAYEAFPQTGTSVYMYPAGDTMRYLRYRDWLISVLYLNTIDYKYFCNCVLEISNTFGWGENAGFRSSMAVLRYLLDHPLCNEPALQDFWDNNWKGARRDWYLGDTTVPFDSTWPSLDSIGLGFLLNSTDVTPPKYSLGGNAITSVSVSDNPFKDETALIIAVSKPVHLYYSLYDVLGKEVLGGRKEVYLDPGENRLKINGSNLPQGTYYLRVETGFGEVKTVKVVKE